MRIDSGRRINPLSMIQMGGQGIGEMPDNLAVAPIPWPPVGSLLVPSCAAGVALPNLNSSRLRRGYECSSPTKWYEAGDSLVDFAHLHCHDQFSFLDGFGKTAEYVSLVKEMKLLAFCQTNHGGLWGWARAFKACREAGVKFIPGIEFFLDGRSVDTTQRRIAWEHLTVLAKDEEGYRNLMRLASLAGQRMVGHLNKRPILDYASLFKHSEGLIVLSGCPSSILVRTVAENEIDRAERIIQGYKKVFGDRFFVEIQPNKTKVQVVANPILVELAHKFKVPTVVTNDVHYPKKEDARVHEVMLCVQTRDSMLNKPDSEGGTRWTFDWPGFYLADPKDVEGWFSKYHHNVRGSEVRSAMARTADIVEMVSVDQPVPKHFILPRISKTPKGQFEEAVRKGFRSRGLHKKQDVQAYVQRLRYEAGLIVKQGLHEYFLIVSDLMQWARQRMLVGPGRGSSGGSLVCYCLGITEVDPLIHRTLFERFITEERSDLPDIDLDFPASRREEVIEYLRQKYGRDNVTNICTFIEFKGKLALRDVAKAFGVHPSEINKVAPLIVQRSGGDARADMTVEDLLEESEDFKEFARKHKEVVQIAIRLEGITRQLGKHAAGVAITDKPSIHYYPTYVTKDGRIMAQWDKDDLEYLKLLKIDVLGIDVLDMLKKTVDLIKERHDEEIDLYTLPLDDPKVFKEFNEGATVGVFQFESRGIAAWCRNIGVTKFRDVVDLNALYRPGTLRSNLIKVYEQRKKGNEEIEYAHPLMKPILEDTYGIPLYQEQIMFLFNRLANFPWKTADTVRKVVSKSQGLEAFDKYKDAFLKGCASRGIEEEVAEKMFATIRTFGSYGFNLSHSVEYSMIAYWCMWLKVHYPLEFMATLISNEQAEDRVVVYLKEAMRLGIEVKPPNVLYSKWGYSIEKKAIRSGYKDIKGIGEKSGEVLVAGGPYKNWGQLQAQKINMRIIKALIQCGATSDLFPHFTIRALHENDWASLKAFWKDIGNKDLWSKLQKVKEYDDAKLLQIRSEVFPINVGKHPLTLYPDLLKRLAKKYGPDHHTPFYFLEDFKWKDGDFIFPGVVSNVGTATIPRWIDGQNRPKKLVYFTLDSERDYTNMMMRGGEGEAELGEQIRRLNGQPVIVKAHVNVERNKMYCKAVRSLEEIAKGSANNV